MKKASILIIALLASFLVIGCQSEAKTDDYGGEVKDSGGKPVPPGKGGAAKPASIDE